LPIGFDFLNLIIYLIITGWNYIISYGTLPKSLKKSIKEYKDILKYIKNNGNLQSKAYKILKSSKNFSITVNTKISILK